MHKISLLLSEQITRSVQWNVIKLDKCQKFKAHFHLLNVLILNARSFPNFYRVAILFGSRWRLKIFPWPSPPPQTVLHGAFPFEMKRAGWSQRMLAIVWCRIFCLPGFTQNYED